jgi:DNA-directed RNA polymerase subunit beta
MLIGQVANGGPKKLAKGAKITKEYLDDLDNTTGSTSVRPTNRATALEAIKESINEKRHQSIWPSKRTQETDPGR